MKLAQFMLKMISPRAEEARMDMREARCHAEASAEDLSRTVALHETDIKRMLQEARKKRSNSQVDGGRR